MSFVEHFQVLVADRFGIFSTLGKNYIAQPGLEPMTSCKATKKFRIEKIGNAGIRTRASVVLLGELYTL